MTHDSLRPSQGEEDELTRLILGNRERVTLAGFLRRLEPHVDSDDWRASVRECMKLADAACEDLVELQAQRFDAESRLEAERLKSAALQQSIDGCAQRLSSLLAEKGRLEDALQEARNELKTLRDGVPCDGSTAIAPASSPGGES